MAGVVWQPEMYGDISQKEKAREHNLLPTAGLHLPRVEDTSERSGRCWPGVGGRRLKGTPTDPRDKGSRRPAANDAPPCLLVLSTIVSIRTTRTFIS